MAQFDVHQMANGDALVLDCQTDLLSHIDSRFIVPLVPPGKTLPAARRLNPVFSIGGGDYVMLTQSASAIRTRDLGPVVTSLAAHHTEIVGALDMLITGV